ncbi:protein BPS1, chloroplastic-like [Ziziphus jujuba]|uniref:Protein BPS1, chloroplastic n=2 Tax=Ziziphus jujuba TaxID=326968 RepID=A0A6P4A6W6_ZIZJJ|nr:protein BPS1, chloroplastic [Ziziphus jujuba]XP_060670640.1 protein BPS1, chloroplastic-like [Ziziphus jujuba]KAH7528016.1 hypothetical protein FEM48_Zijuj05G0027100 [Ziziphus jujuba var. spinosa]
MVLLVPKIGKLYTKQESHHLGCKSEALSSALEAFRSDVSNGLNKLSVNSKPRLEILSFSWIQQCFELINIINKAFAKLVVDIDCPMNKWEAASVEEYLKYSLNLLELLNSISLSISNLGHSRLRISHALSLVEESPSLAIESLKASHTMNSSKEFKRNMNKEDGKEKSYSGKERVIHEAMIVMESMGFWICGILLSGICGDEKPYSEMRKFSSRLVVFSSFPRLDSSICEAIMEKKSELVELKELKDAEACLVAAITIGKYRDGAEELQRRLEKFEKLLEGLGKEVDHVFKEVLNGRNQLLKSLQQRKQ